MFKSLVYHISGISDWNKIIKYDYHIVGNLAGVTRSMNEARQSCQDITQC